MTDTGVHVSVFHTAGIISDHSEQITVIWKHHDTCKTMINNTIPKYTIESYSYKYKPIKV